MQRTLRALHALVKQTLFQVLRENTRWFDLEIQIFVVIMIDGDIETAPGSGRYSNTLESEPEWVSSSSETKDTVEQEGVEAGP